MLHILVDNVIVMAIAKKAVERVFTQNKGDSSPVHDSDKKLYHMKISDEKCNGIPMFRYAKFGFLQCAG